MNLSIFKNSVAAILIVLTAFIVSAQYYIQRTTPQNKADISLLVVAPAEMCISTSELDYEGKLRMDIEQENIYFVGCGGFF